MQATAGESRQFIRTAADIRVPDRTLTLIIAGLRTPMAMTHMRTVQHMRTNILMSGMAVIRTSRSMADLGSRSLEAMATAVMVTGVGMAIAVGMGTTAATEAVMGTGTEAGTTTGTEAAITTVIAQVDTAIAATMAVLTGARGVLQAAEVTSPADHAVSAEAAGSMAVADLAAAVVDAGNCKLASTALLFVKCRCSLSLLDLERFLKQIFC